MSIGLVVSLSLHTCAPRNMLFVMCSIRNVDGRRRRRHRWQQQPSFSAIESIAFNSRETCMHASSMISVQQQRRQLFFFCFFFRSFEKHSSTPSSQNIELCERTRQRVTCVCVCARFFIRVSRLPHSINSLLSADSHFEWKKRIKLFCLFAARSPLTHSLLLPYLQLAIHLVGRIVVGPSAHCHRWCWYLYASVSRVSSAFCTLNEIIILLRNFFFRFCGQTIAAKVHDMQWFV